MLARYRMRWRVPVMNTARTLPPPHVREQLQRPKTTTENIRSTAIIISSPGETKNYRIVVVWNVEIDHIMK